jgi:hypothetical protein
MLAIVTLSITLEGKHSFMDSGFKGEDHSKKSIESYPSELEFRSAVMRVQ